MTNTKSKRTPWLQSFNTFNFRFFHACFVMRGVLGVQLMLVLAGGLEPGNVVAAIDQVAPIGVDTASGVESSPGCKDPERMRQFVTAARYGLKMSRRVGRA